MVVKYQNIQILRIFSCIGIFLVHFGQILELSGIARKCTDFGSNGVNMFFVISGFVAFLSTENSEKNVKEYYLMRSIRIGPMYYLVIIYYFVLHVFILQDVPQDTFSLGWLRYFLFFNIFSTQNNDFWSNLGFTWSIFSFVLFYIMMPILRKVCRSFYQSGIICLMLYFLSFHIRIIAFENMYIFVIGIVIYYTLKEQKEDSVICGCIILIITHSIISNEYNSIIRILMFILLIIASRKCKISNQRITKVIDKLDEYTYTIYLMHGISIGLIEVYKTYVPHGWFVGAIIIGLVGTVLFSMIVHELIELPIQKKLKNRLKKIKV